TVITAGCSSAEGIYSDKGQVFRKVIPQDISSLDSALVTDTVSFDLFNQVYEGLYTLDKNDKAQPGVAKEMPKKSNGGKTLTSKLTKDARWCKGAPAAAPEFVRASRRVSSTDTATEYAYIVNDLTNAENINIRNKDAEKRRVSA